MLGADLRQSNLKNCRSRRVKPPAFLCVKNKRKEIKFNKANEMNTVMLNTIKPNDAAIMPSVEGNIVPKQQDKQEP